MSIMKKPIMQFYLILCDVTFRLLGPVSASLKLHMKQTEIAIFFNRRNIWY